MLSTRLSKMLRNVALTLGLICAAATAQAGGYIGDYAPGDTVDCNFGTVRPSTGASYTLAGTPAISVYKDNGTTESTTGVTLTADFDTRAGLNHVRVTTASDGTFFSAGSFFEVVITAGTVDSVSVIGQPVCSFSLAKVSALRPATAGRTLTVSSGGAADANVAPGGISEASFATTAGSVAPLGLTRQGTAQGATSTTVTLDASAPFADNTNIGSTAWVRGSTNGNYWQSCSITAYVASSKIATLSCPSGFVTPTGTISYQVFGVPPGSGGSGLDAPGVRSALGMSSANMDTQFAGLQADTDNIQTRIPTVLISGRMDATVGAYQTGLTPLQPTVAGRALDVSAGGEAGIDLANVGSPTTSLNLSGTTISTTQIVASVSGNVGGTVNGLTTTAQGNLRTALGMASANLDTQLSGLSAATAVIDAIVDQLLIGVNVEQMNGNDICGTGDSGTPWKGCP
jgi:hypothetical protein